MSEIGDRLTIEASSASADAAVLNVAIRPTSAIAAGATMPVPNDLFHVVDHPEAKSANLGDSLKVSSIEDFAKTIDRDSGFGSEDESVGVGHFNSPLVTVTVVRYIGDLDR